MKTFQHTPKHCMPKVGTQAYQLLAVLTDGNPHQTPELVELLKADPRSALQALRNNIYGYWLIRNVGDSKGCYVLDKRHLSGSPTDDMEARKIAKIMLREKSRELAERGACRVEMARQLEIEAKHERQLSIEFSPD